MTASELVARIAARELTALEATEAALARIVSLDGELGAFLHVFADSAREQARAVDAGRRSGPLAGLPVAIKDNMCTRGQPTTCGSRILENFVPPYEATAVARLQAAGAVVLGKTNLDEFAMGSSTENSAFQVTRNPWDASRVPGGSSGGSAAAVAAGMAPLALGSDTGGSIRQPAAFCGVTGLKPTYGRISRYGLVAFASSLDQIGPMARSARDCALAMGVLAGYDPLDTTSSVEPVGDYTSLLESGVKGLKLGIPRGFLGDLATPMARAFEEACQVLVGLGANLVTVDLPNLGAALPAYYIVAPAEASSNLARYDGTRYGFRAPDAGDVLTMFKRSRSRGFGAEVKRRIMVGTYVLSAGYYDAYYLKAQKVRTVLSRDFTKAFQQVDLIVMPTTPSTAFKIGEKSSDPLEMYLSDIYTVVLNLVGLPGLVVPSAPVNGLPTGLQLIGRAFDEGRLLAVGHAFQEATDFHLKRPELTSVS